MKFSLTWLQQLVDLKLPIEKLAAQLTDIGLEVESITGDIIEVSVAANRADCLGIVGIAREVAAINKILFTAPSIPVVPASITDKINVTVQDSTACPKYLSRVIKNINNTVVTPQWMQERLIAADINTISPVVDITNYVMIELGQPLHAYDLAKLDTEIIVRRAKAAETIALLDDKVLELKTDTLVIADKNKPVALAGIMGGKDSGVTAKTTDISIESAYFDPIEIRLAARRVGIQSDASYYYERNIDASMRHAAMERATELLLEIVGGQAGPVVTFEEPANLPKQIKILLRQSRITRVLGISVPLTDVTRILQQLGMQTEQDENNDLIVTIPTHRVDITREIDLIEEVVRIFGFDNIPAQLPVGTLAFIPQPESAVSEDKILNCLINRGYNEAITYSFIDAEFTKQFVSQLDTSCSITNPIAADMSLMRPSLIPGLINALMHNQNRQQARVRLCEIGLRFSGGLKNLQQTKTIAGVCTGTYAAESWNSQARDVDFYDIKNDVLALFKLAHNVKIFEFRPSTDPALHPGRSLEIFLQDRTVGKLGELHPIIKQNLGLTSAVYIFELDYEVISNGQVTNFKAFSKYPAVRRDLALVVDDKISVERLERAVKESVGSLLTELITFDVYQGKGIVAGKKSIGLGLTLQHAERTLTDMEVNEIFTKLIADMGRDFQATLR